MKVRETPEDWLCAWIAPYMWTKRSSRTPSRQARRRTACRQRTCGSGWKASTMTTLAATRCKTLAMPDSSAQLQRLYGAGFELQTFERFPGALGVFRDSCMAFLVPGSDGLQILGNAGWRMGESLGPQGSVSSSGKARPAA